MTRSSERTVPDLAGSAEREPIASVVLQIASERYSGTLILWPASLTAFEIRLCFETGWLVAIDGPDPRDLIAAVRAAFGHRGDYAFYSGSELLSSSAVPCALDPVALLRGAAAARPDHLRATLDSLGDRMRFTPHALVERLALKEGERGALDRTRAGEVATLEPDLLYALALIGALRPLAEPSRPFERARAARARGELAAARTALIDAITRAPKDPNPHAELARVWLAWGDGEADAKRAVLAANAALRLDKAHVEAHLAKAAALTRLRWFDRAELHYARALELDPENAEALHALERSGTQWSLAQIAKVLGIGS